MGYMGHARAIGEIQIEVTIDISNCISLETLCAAIFLYHG